jgi:hypothetical protein
MIVPVRPKSRNTEKGLKAYRERIRAHPTNMGTNITTL